MFEGFACAGPVIFRFQTAHIYIMSKIVSFLFRKLKLVNFSIGEPTQDKDILVFKRKVILACICLLNLIICVLF